MARKLTEKVALVSDASCAIGVAIAKRLARDSIDVAISYMMSADKAKAVVRALGGHGVRILVSTLDLRELLSAISACLKRVMPHDGASLALYDPVSHMLRASALEFPGHEDVMMAGELFPLEGNPAGLALTTRRTVLCDARKAEDLHAALKRLRAAGVKSGCSIPLISCGRGLGVLCLVRLSDGAFTDDDVDVLTQIANQVAIAVENALSFREIDALKKKLAEEKLYLEEEIRTEHNFEEVIGKSCALKRVLQQVEMVAHTDSTVLIVGETGTGKELLARAIHNLSPRRQHTFVKVNCAAIPTGLLESELFGHEKGAFTGAIERRFGRFELAHQGTIFLDEVGDVPLELQSKLLRVL
jgi:formate hydrogenlyase transcriptional activator